MRTVGALLIALAALLPASLTAAEALRPLDEKVYEGLLKSHRGKVVLVDIWATWCAPCRDELPVLGELEKKLRDRGLVLITISADEPEQEVDAQKLLEQFGLSFPAYIKRVETDESFINFIDRKWSGALPALFLYDRSGNRVQSFIGETAPADIEAAVSKLL